MKADSNVKGVFKSVRSSQSQKQEMGRPILPEGRSEMGMNQMTISLIKKLLCKHEGLLIETCAYLFQYNLLLNMQLVDSQYQLPLETRQWGQVYKEVPTPTEAKRPSSSAFSLYRPPPATDQPELSRLSQLSEHLQKEIAQAKKEQDLMLDFFNQMMEAEQGKKPAAKKGKRRSPEDAYQRFVCARCSRFYTSDSSLKRHVRLKHDQLGDDPPQKYHTLHPEPDLPNVLELSQDSSQFEPSSQRLQTLEKEQPENHN